MKERYAVSGSNGFIGSHLTERLKQEGEVVRLKRDGIVFDNELACIFDLAAYGNMYGQNDVPGIYKANLMRLFDVLETTQDNIPLIYVSTSSVMLPKQTFYSASKKAAEEMLQIYAERNNRRIAIVRPYSITGVGEQKEHLIPKLIDSCLNGTEMPFVAEPTHDWLDVDDFVEALLIIKEKGQLQGEVYDVGTGNCYTNQEVLWMVEKITDRYANLKLVDSMREYDNKSWVADTTRIRSLGWKPEKTLKESIREQVESYEKKM